MQRKGTAMSQTAAMGRLTKDLSQSTRSRKSAVGDMRRASTKKVTQMANSREKATSDLRADLSRDVHALVDQTRVFLDAAAQIVPAFARAHQKMAKQQKSSLEAGRRKLGTEVAKFRSAMQHDLMGAREIWSSFRMAEAPAAAKRKR